MDEIARQKFETGVRILALRLAARALLGRYLEATPTPASRRETLATLKERFIRDVKNFIPSPNVADPVHQAAIAMALEDVEAIFADIVIES